MPAQPTVQMLPEWPQEAQGGRFTPTGTCRGTPERAILAGYGPPADSGWVKTCLSCVGTLVALLGAPEGAETLWTPDSGLSNREHPDESPLPSGIHAPINSSRCSFPRTRGSPRSARISGPSAPPLPKADAHRPMVWGFLSRASAVSAAVQPWASSHMANHRSRSLGVGDIIIRRRRFPHSHLPLFEMLVHPSHARYQRLPGSRTGLPGSSRIYLIPLRISPRLRFGPVSYSGVVFFSQPFSGALPVLVLSRDLRRGRRPG